MDYKVTDTELTAVADAIRAKGSTSAPLTWESGFASAISAIPTGITPSGTLSIGANGDYDVTNYASASVSVPGLVPSGTYSITSNGIYDVTNYASADVTVGGTDTRFKELVERTISSIVGDSTITEIGQYAFARCVQLITASFPNVTSISGSAFISCNNLITASFPNATVIGLSAFYYCSNLITASFPNAQSLSSGAFGNCSGLTTVDFPNVNTIQNSALASCINLTMASFPKATSIPNYTFNKCYNLLSLYLMGSSIATLQSATAFSSTPIDGYTTSTGGVYGSIFVPSSLYSQYIVANNWSNYAARFVSV